MKQLKRSYVRSARLLFALLLACMIAGSIYDFQISSFLYPGKESSFGQFFAAFGELPAFLALICAGVLLFRHRGCLRRDWNVLFLIGAFGLIFGGIFLSVHEATDNVPAMPAWVPLLVTVFFAALCSAALLLVTSGAQGKTVIRFVLTLVFVCVGTMLLINIIKVPWGRARMRLIASTAMPATLRRGGKREAALKTSWSPKAYRPMNSARSRPGIPPAPPARCSLRFCLRYPSSSAERKNDWGFPARSGPRLSRSPGFVWVRTF